MCHLYEKEKHHPGNDRQGNHQTSCRRENRQKNALPPNDLRGFVKKDEPRIENVRPKKSPENQPEEQDDKDSEES